MASPVEPLERLQLLASAIAARDVQVAPTTPGDLPWTDGTTIHIDPAADPSAQVQALTVQASLLAAESLDADIVRRLKRSRSAAKRYLAVEGHRALALNETFLPTTTRQLVDLAVASRTNSADDSLGIALSTDELAEPPASFGAIRPREVLTALERMGVQPTSSGQSDTQLSDVAVRALDDEDDDAGSVGQILTSPVGGGGPVGRLLQRLLRQTRGRGDGGPVGANAPARMGRGRSGTGSTVVATRAAAALEAGEALGKRRLTYPEWNVHRGAYRADWCTVVECDPPKNDKPAVVADGAALRRPLARLGLGLVRCHRQPQGDDIDIDAAVEARVDTLAGSSPNEALYIESLRRSRDLSVLILLDISGSAAEPGPSGVSVHEHQRAAAAELMTALHDLGDRVALYAFNSQGRSSVRVARVKEFDDHLDGHVGERLGSLVPGSFTRLGAAIRHGGSVLEGHGGTSRRLLVVLSDGLAYDHGYEGRYAEADARRALSETRRRGVGCLCLSVGAGVDAQALRRVFGTAAHASVPTVDRLAPNIAPLFRAALRSAEAQRRVYQRTERTRERLEIDRRELEESVS